MKPKRALFARRPRWSLVLLFISVAAIAAAATQAYRTVRSQQGVAESVRRDYARFAAWSYREHVIAQLSQVARETLGPVNHGSSLHTSRDFPHAAQLGHYLPWDARCDCHVSRWGMVPSRFYGFTLGADTLGLGLNHARDPLHGWRGGPDEDMADEMSMGDTGLPARAGPEDAWINDTITRLTRAGHRPATGFDFILARRAGHLRLLAYTLMPTAWGDTIVYAAEYERAALEALLARQFDEEAILPATFTRTRRTGELVALRVSATDGEVLLDRGPGPREGWRLDTGLNLPAAYGGLCVHAQVRPEMASALVIGGLPASRLPFLLGLLVLAAALSVVAAAQLRRESELTRMRGDFVAAVSHELRTPLAQIRLFVETLRLGRADTAQARQWSLEQIDRETRRLSQLVENVLRFSAPGSAHRVPLATEPVELASELREIVAEFQPLAESRRTLVQLDAPPGVCARASRDGLRQVLLNLLDNAVKYGPPRQTVRVRLTCDAAQARIAVEDAGPGVPAKERELIWLPFRRGEGVAVRAVGGSGIGLTLVRDIVQEQGGRVWVEDAPGGGAAFIVLLPLALPEPAPAGAAPALPVRQAALGPTLAGEAG